MAAEVVSDDNYPALRARFPNGVVGQPDIVYARPPGFRPLTLDLYRPRGSARRPLPLIIYVHGGAWRGGHSRAAGAFADFPRVLASLAARGFVVASINYRLSGEARYPAAADDVRAAIAYLRANARRFGVEPGKVILWGSSAGAQLAALAATRCNCVQGVVTWYGIFDLSSLEPDGRADSSPTAAYLGCSPSRCAERATEASPVAHVDRSDPPFLIMHGLADRVVSPAQSQAMEGLLRRAGVPVETLYLPGIDHSWIGPAHAETERASRTALERTLSFIRSLFPERDRSGPESRPPRSGGQPPYPRPVRTGRWQR